MKIQSSNVSMYAQRSYEAERTANTTFETTYFKADSEKENEKEELTFSDMVNGTKVVEKERMFPKDKMGNSMVPAAERISKQGEKTSYQTIRHRCILYLLQILCNGKNMQHEKFEDMMQQMKQGGNQAILNTTLMKPLEGITLNLKTQDYYHEKESLSFQSQGIVRTADGREFGFNMDVSMSREFAAYTEFEQEVTQFVDPLVINLNGNITGMSDQKFMFDLDADGTLDRISMLETGSGFLAFDKNGDGMINDGTELFGTTSGDGFRDLEIYDEDGNGWIDEADSVFEKLLIWTKDEMGNDELYSLKKAGIGAICLQKAETDFSLTSIKNNQLNGKVRSTGVFLYENGNAGTLQHLDVAT